MGANMAKLAGILSAAIGGYLLVCLLTFLLQRQFIYFPVVWSEAEAHRWNPGYEEVRIPAGDGTALHGWLHRNWEAPWTVVIFHGNAGNLSFHEATLPPFRDLGLQVLLFDYRGFGLSTGSPTEAGLVRDGEAVADYLEKGLGVLAERWVYFGQSLGAGVAVGVAARRPPARLVLYSAFDSLAAVARHHYFFLPVDLLLRDRFDAAAAIGKVRCPVLFLHPAEDEIVPLERGRALFRRANPPKRFVEIPEGRHNDPPGLPPSPFEAALREFLDLPR